MSTVMVTLAVEMRCPECRAVIIRTVNAEAAAIIKGIAARVTCNNRRCNTAVLASRLDVIPS